MQRNPMILCWNKICIYLLLKQAIVSNKHSPFFSYTFVSFCPLSLIHMVFDLKEVFSSKQVLSSFLSQMEENNKRVAKSDEKTYMPKNVIKHDDAILPRKGPFTRAMSNRLQEDWARAAEEGPKVLMNLRVDFWAHGSRLGPIIFVHIRLGCHYIWSLYLRLHNVGKIP